MKQLTYADLRAAIGGRAAGLRIKTEYEPMGGPGDKVFPPTYDQGAYAKEKRRIGGETVEAVILASVADQANRQELALLEQKRAGAPIPTIASDFGNTEVADLGQITALEASHRMFDALFRDSEQNGTKFPKTEPGKALTAASDKNAAALLKYCPSGLVFGAWDSTGPKGGLGAKYERAITTEIVALGVEYGVKTSSRLDVLAIEKKAGEIYHVEDDAKDWAIDPEQAKKDKNGKPVLYSSGGNTDKGRPSQINHGNIVPSVDEHAGGVTADTIVGTTVLSFIRLRQINFPVNADGEPLGAQQPEAELAARCALAALALLAVTTANEQGHDLRSRCVIVPSEQSKTELIGAAAGDLSNLELSSEAARALLEEAVATVRSTGLEWSDEDVVLTPMEKLVELIVKSRDVSAAPTEND